VREKKKRREKKKGVLYSPSISHTLRTYLPVVGGGKLGGKKGRGGSATLVFAISEERKKGSRLSA